MQEFAGRRDPEKPEPSLDDLTVVEEQRLFKAAREMEGPVSEEARERLFILSWPVVARAAHRYRRSLGEDAFEDLLQDQRLNALELIDKHDPEKGRFAAYVATHTKFNGLAAINKAGREIPILDDEGEMGNAKDRIADTRQSVEEAVMKSQPKSTIDASSLLSTLPDDEREVIELLIFNDTSLTRQEIAQHLGVSVATVGYRKSRALERLLDSDELSKILNQLGERGEHESLVFTELGKAIIERRQVRIANARDRFMAMRAEKLAKEEAERAMRPLRRQQSLQERASKRAAEIAERRKQREAEQAEAESLAAEQHAILEARRKLILERLQEERRDRLADIGEQLALPEVRVLAYLHLSEDEGSELLGIPKSALRRRVMRAKERVGVETRAELALWALDHGVSYVVTEPPEMTKFTVRERLVASRLWRQNPDIAEDLGITHKQVTTDVMSLLKKTGAKNRTELALVAQLYGFEPFPEELEDDTHEALQPFTKQEREVLSRLHLPSEIIRGELGLPNKYAVDNAAKRALERVGAANRTALALRLLENGLDFDITEPGRPLHELLTQQELEISQALDRPYEEIAEQQGLTTERVNRLVGYIKAKTGARSRVELALMARVFDTGRAKPVYHNMLPREDRFFGTLGIEPIPMEQARELLEHVTPRQAEYIEAYYFSAEVVSWRAISERFFVRREVAIQIANRGLARIREKLQEQKQAA